MFLASLNVVPFVNKIKSLNIIIYQAKYEGVGDGMESAGALEICQRFEVSRGVQYTK